MEIFTSRIDNLMYKNPGNENGIPGFDRTFSAFSDDEADILITMPCYGPVYTARNVEQNQLYKFRLA